MPGFDGTGPMGNGPRTGRGMGRCGMGVMRNSFCRGCRFQQPYAYENELAELKSREVVLEEELAVLRDRIAGSKK